LQVGNFGVDALLLFFESVDGGGQDVTREFSGHGDSVLFQMYECVRKVQRGGRGVPMGNVRETNGTPSGVILI
jgi:hypothetical protein